MLCAGDLNDTITIRQKSSSRAANGEEIVTWTTLVSSLPAFIKPLNPTARNRAGEFVDLSREVSILALEIRIRYRTGINTTMQVVWRGNPYEIEAMIPGGFKNKTELTLLCSGASEDA